MKPLKTTLTVLLLSLLSQACVYEDEFETSHGSSEKYDWNERYEKTPTPDSKLHLYLPTTPNAAPSPLILILPGGCYAYHAKDYEGTNWVPFVLKSGYAAAVLEYDLPWGNPDSPIDHVNRTISYLKNTSELNIDPEHIGIMGFSAGGHLATLISTQTDKDSRPAFQVLFYPITSMEDKHTNTFTHKVCRENLLGTSPSSSLKAKYSSYLNIDPNTPPAFIAVGNKDNTVSVENSYAYIDALNQNNIKNTIIIAPKGDHGYIEWSNLTNVRQTLRKWLTDQLSPEENQTIQKEAH